MEIVNPPYQHLETDIKEILSGPPVCFNSLEIMKLIPKVAGGSPELQLSSIEEEQIILDLGKLKSVPQNPAISFEGIRGVGKTTLIKSLTNLGVGVSGDRISTPFLEIIKCLGCDVCLSVFGGEGKPRGAVVDTLLVAAHHYERLNQLATKHGEEEKLQLIDRHTLSFMSLEEAKLIHSGVNEGFARSFVCELGKKWNRVKATFCVNGMSVQECEERLLKRGEQPRSEREKSYDSHFLSIISKMMYGNLPGYEKVADKVVYLNGQDIPGVLVEKAMGEINKLL